MALNYAGQVREIKGKKQIGFRDSETSNLVFLNLEDGVKHLKNDNERNQVKMGLDIDTLPKISQETADAKNTIASVVKGLEVAKDVLEFVDLALLTEGASVVAGGVVEGGMIAAEGTSLGGGLISGLEGSVLRAGAGASELLGFGEIASEDLFFVIDENLISFEEGILGVSERETLGMAVPSASRVSATAANASKVGGLINEATPFIKTVKDVADTLGQVAGIAGLVESIFGKGKTPDEKKPDNNNFPSNREIVDNQQPRQPPNRPLLPPQEVLSAADHDRHKSIMNAFGI